MDTQLPAVIFTLTLLSVLSGRFARGTVPLVSLLLSKATQKFRYTRLTNS
jgi:hypothetical protein